MTALYAQNLPLQHSFKIFCFILRNELKDFENFQLLFDDVRSSLEIFLLVLAKKQFFVSLIKEIHLKQHCEISVNTKNRNIVR